MTQSPYYVTKIASLDEAFNAGIRVCVFKGQTSASVLNTLNAAAGNKLTIVETQAIGITNGNQVALNEVSTFGKCDGAFVPRSDFDIFKQSTKSNINCNLVSPGSVIRQIDGAW